MPYTEEIVTCDNPYEVNILDGFLTENTIHDCAGDIKRNALDCMLDEENLIQIICKKTL